MSKLTNAIPDWLVKGLVGIIVFVAGFATNYWVDYRGRYIESLTANYDKFDDTTREIASTLKVFAEIAQGEKEKSPSDLDALERQLLKAVGQVEDLARRIGQSANFVAVYQDAALKLRNAALEITGPQNGKPMVVAVSDYYLAEEHVREAVLDEQGSFLW